MPPYELGIRDDLTQTLVGQGASMGMHECQSRFLKHYRQEQGVLGADFRYGGGYVRDSVKEREPGCLHCSGQ